MFISEGGKPFLQEASIEIRVVGDDEDDPIEQIVDGAIVDAMTGDHLIGNTGDLRDLRWDGKAGIFATFITRTGNRFPPLIISLTSPSLSALAAGHDCMRMHGVRFCLCEKKRRFWLLGDTNPDGGIGGQPVMLDLQRGQFEHDELFHREIARLDVAARLKHMALHFCKYTGQFAATLQSPDNAALKLRTITDSFIISLCSANALNLNLSERVAPQLGANYTLRDLGSYLASQLYPATPLDDAWLLATHAIYAARMARACEKIDHLEAFPFREELQEAVLSLCRLTLIAASANNIDLNSAVHARRQQIQHPFISALSDRRA